MKYLLIFSLIILLSCEGVNVNPDSKTLEGVWVEVSNYSDTLKFLNIDGSEYLSLNRGSETKGGFQVPKSGSGPYEYNILSEEKISLRWSLSSNSDFNEYIFKQSGNFLIIEKFFDPPSPGVFLTFRRIK